MTDGAGSRGAASQPKRPGDRLAACLGISLAALLVGVGIFIALPFVKLTRGPLLAGRFSQGGVITG